MSSLSCLIEKNGVLRSISLYLSFISSLNSHYLSLRHWLTALLNVLYTPFEFGVNLLFKVMRCHDFNYNFIQQEKYSLRKFSFPTCYKLGNTEFVFTQKQKKIWQQTLFPSLLCWASGIQTIQMIWYDMILFTRMMLKWFFLCQKRHKMKID